MQLREIVFQGTLGYETAVRLRADAELSTVQLPASVSVDDVQDIVTALLYPLHLSARQKTRLGEGGKMAAVLESERYGRHRVMRAGADELSLQREEHGQYREVVRGASAVQKALLERLRLPEYRVFLALNLWRFDEPYTEAVSSWSEFGSDPRIPELIEMYRDALEVEAIEDATKELEIRVEEAEKALGEFAEVNEKLERARAMLAEIALPDLTAEELELLRSKNEQLEEFEQQVERLINEEDLEKRQIDLVLPDSPRRAPMLWAGLAIGVVATLVSVVFHETMRTVALANLVGFFLVATVLLQYFNNLGRASIHQARLESIKRRLNQVREEQINYLETIDHLLIHAGIDDEQELFARVPRAAKLREVITRLEAQHELLRADPAHVEARTRYDDMYRELERLRSRRKELPDFVMSSFQLENDLETMGVDPAAVRAARPAGAEASNAAGAESGDGFDAAEPAQYEEKPFERLLLVARATNQWSGRALEPTAHKMWARICSHVLNERFAEVGLTEAGELVVGNLTPDQLELWARTRASEVRAVAGALALALHVNAEEGAELRSIWIGDPASGLVAAQASRFETVFRSAARRSHIVFCRA